jgi:hypothetical protein
VSRNIEKELAAKEAARKADREQEKALKKAATKTNYEQDQALKTPAGQTVTTEDSMRVEPSPPTPEAILNTAAMDPHTSLDNSTSSSDNPLPTNESFLPLVYTEDLLSKPATPEINASNNSDTLQCNRVSHEIAGESEAFLPLLPRSDPTNSCDTPNAWEEAPSHIIGLPENNETLGNNDRECKAETVCLPHIDPTHPCNKPNSWDVEENVTCAAEGNQILPATVPNMQNEKALEESPGKDGKKSPTDATSPATSRSDDTNHALSDGLPTSPLSACILTTVAEKPEENFFGGSSTSSKVLPVSNPSENIASEILPREPEFPPVVFSLPIRPKKRVLDLAVSKEKQKPAIKLPALVADNELEKFPNALSMEKPEEDLLYTPSTSNRVLSVSNPSDEFSSGTLPRELEHSPMVFSLPIRPKNRALDLFPKENQKLTKVKIPAFVVDEKHETSHNPHLMGARAEGLALKIAEKEPEKDLNPDASTSSMTPSVLTPSENFASGILPNETDFSPVVFSLPIRPKKQTLETTIQEITVPKEEQKPKIKFPALVTDEILEPSLDSASVGARAEVLGLTVVKEEQAVNTSADDDGHEIAYTGAISEETIEECVETSTQATAANLKYEKSEASQAEIILIGGMLNPNGLQDWLVSSFRSMYSNFPPLSTFLLYSAVAMYTLMTMLITLLRSLAKLLQENRASIEKMMSYIRTSPWMLLFVLLTGSERLVLGAMVGIGVMLLAGGYEWGQGLEEVRREGVLGHSEGALESGV